MNLSIVPYNDPTNKPFVYNFNGYPVRVFILDDSLWWIASDVCERLELGNVSKVVDRLENDEKTTITISDSGRPMKILMVNEPGLYSLLATSRKPEAKAFKHWVYHEVIPSIIKTGKYITTPVSPPSALDLLDGMLQQLRAQDAKIDQIESVTTDTAVKVQDIETRLDRADYMTVKTWCDSQRINCTASIVQMWGKSAAALSREKGIEILHIPVHGQAYGTVNEYHKDILVLVCVPRPKVSARQLKLTDDD